MVGLLLRGGVGRQGSVGGGAITLGVGELGGGEAGVSGGGAVTLGVGVVGGGV